MSREQHNESVAVALAEIEALKGRLIAASEKQNECLGVMAMAVGDPPATEAGRAAFEWIAYLEEGISTLVRTCENAHVALQEYSGGF